MYSTPTVGDVFVLSYFFVKAPDVLKDFVWIFWRRAPRMTRRFPSRAEIVSVRIRLRFILRLLMYHGPLLGIGAPSLTFQMPV